MEEYNKLKDAYDSLVKEHQEANQRIEQYEMRLHTLELENVRQRENIETWRKHYIESNNQVGRFRKENDELKENYKKMEESCVEKSNKIAELIREYEEQRDDGYYLEIIDELHEKIDEMNDLVDDLNEEVADYKHLKRTLKDLVC